jgi:hypothetical protein
MKRIMLAAILAMFCAQADAGVIYQQPPRASGGFYHSSWLDPDGSNYDEYVWDKFVLASAADIDTIEWRGAYDPAFSGAGGPVVDFWVGIYGSIAGGSEPDVAHPPLVEYQVGGNAGETYAGVFGGATMYDYNFALPVAFHAQAGVPYWVHVEGWQWGTYPDWSVAAGTGGDGSHFRCRHVTNNPVADVPTGCSFNTITGDAAFTLLTTAVAGAEDAPGTADFALSGPLPNPSRGDRLDVLINLPDTASAELSLFDVGGRRVAFKQVGALGEGPQVVDLAAWGPLEPGIYFVRLSHGGRSQRVKVIVTH